MEQNKKQRTLTQFFIEGVTTYRSMCKWKHTESFSMTGQEIHEP